MPYCKRLIICCFTFLLSANVFAQADMTGLWTGLMYNDTTNLNYRYEIAISEKNGNLSGYSHTYFILDGIEYYGVKKIRITIEKSLFIYYLKQKGKDAANLLTIDFCNGFLGKFYLKITCISIFKNTQLFVLLH